jgi:anhydro-N-acetylmuramic acid kinase
MHKQTNIIGLMSGTSLDGLDIAYCEFINNDGEYQIQQVITHEIGYSSLWKKRLSEAHLLSAEEFVRLDHDFGRFLGKETSAFIYQHNLEVHYISSHGHTVFHNPKEGYTTQIGHGADIMSETGIDAIYDFRASDVALGGQGAPLVPAGDELLFDKYDYCLNLGGFANISYKNNENKTVAFDICPVNFVINYLVGKLGEEYDESGRLGSSGTIIPGLLNELNNLPFYRRKPPKSLGREWVEKNIFPLLNDKNQDIKDVLRTFYEHLAVQINNALTVKYDQSLLITGGGAKNTFLIDRLSHYISGKIIIPEEQIISFKEAIIFAFLGLLRTEEKPNCLCKVTGSQRNNVGGAWIKA